MDPALYELNADKDPDLVPNNEMAPDPQDWPLVYILADEFRYLVSLFQKPKYQYRTWFARKMHEGIKFILSKPEVSLYSHSLADLLMNNQNAIAYIRLIDL